MTMDPHSTASKKILDQVTRSRNVKRVPGPGGGGPIDSIHRTRAHTSIVAQSGLNALPAHATQNTVANQISRRRMEAEKEALRHRMKLTVTKKQHEIKKQKEIFENTRQWEDVIMPNWPEYAHSTKVRDLCIKGIPTKVRGKVWPMLIGNDLEITEEIFEKLNIDAQTLFHDKMTAARSRRKRQSGEMRDDRNDPGMQVAESYETDDPSLYPVQSYIMHDQEVETVSSNPSDGQNNYDDQNTNRYDDRTVSTDIRIPRHFDITEQSWFENEREGSLDEDAFKLIQKQLFERPMHQPQDPGGLSQRMMKHDHSLPPTINEIASSQGSQASWQQNSTRYYDQDPNLEMAMGDFDDPEAMLTPTPAKLPKPKRVKAKAKSPRSDSSYVVVQDGTNESENISPMSVSANTPPRRARHSADYLTAIGLLPEETLLHDNEEEYDNNGEEQDEEDGEEDEGVFAHQTRSSRSQSNNSSNNSNDHSTIFLRCSTPDEVLDFRPSLVTTTEAVLRARILSSELTSQFAKLEVNSSPKESMRELEGEEEKVKLDPKMENTMKVVSLIEWDLPRTFPTLAFFHDGGIMHTGLERVLLCYALYCPDIGYVQGMSFLVAMLLLCMDEYAAFTCLANLLSQRTLRDFYRIKKEPIDGFVHCFDYYFKKFLPLLYEHFQQECVETLMYLMDWHLSLFTKALPLEIATKVWDAYLCEGEVYVLCVGLGILKMFAPKLSTFSVEKICPFLLHLPETIKSDELFANVAQISISKKHYEKIRKRTEQVRSPASPANHNISGNNLHANNNSNKNSLNSLNHALNQDASSSSKSGGAAQASNLTFTASIKSAVRSSLRVFRGGSSSSTTQQSQAVDNLHSSNGSNDSRPRVHITSTTTSTTPLSLKEVTEEHKTVEEDGASYENRDRLEAATFSPTSTPSYSSTLPNSQQWQVKSKTIASIQYTEDQRRHLQLQQQKANQDAQQSQVASSSSSQQQQSLRQKTQSMNSASTNNSGRHSKGGGSNNSNSKPNSKDGKDATAFHPESVALIACRSMPQHHTASA